MQHLKTTTNQNMLCRGITKIFNHIVFKMQTKIIIYPIEQHIISLTKPLNIHFDGTRT